MASKRIRWWIVWTLFGSTVINYISRQTFSVLAPVITQELHLSHTDLSRVFSAFQFSYAGMWLIGGVLLDVIGTRLGLALAVIWWSAISMLTGFANSLFSFGAFRFLLGIGEGCNWPGASKTVAEWFPAKERGVAVAIFDSGSSVGGAIAALTVPWVAILLGWRYAFVVSGVLGFLWLIVWLAVYHPLDRHPRVDPRGTCADRGGARYGHGIREKRCGPLAEPFEAAEYVGNRSGPFPDRPHLVVLRFLAAAVSQRRARVQPQTDCRVRLAALRGGGYRELHGRLRLRLSDQARHARGARAQMGLRHQFPADSGRDPRRQNPQPLRGAIPDQFCRLGLCKLVNDGPYLPLRLVSAGRRRHRNRLQWTRRRLGRSRLFTLLVGWLVDKFSYYPAFFLAATVPMLATLSVLLLIRPPQVESRQ